MDCPPGGKKVAFVKRWPLVEVRLYTDLAVHSLKDIR